MPVEISTIVATHRRPRLLAEALDSALAQSCPPGELIVVDDDPGCSARAVAAAAGGRVRYLPRARSSGGFAGEVRNDGLAIASGRLVHFLDDDDLLAPGAYAALTAALAEQRAAAAAFGEIEPFGAQKEGLAHERNYFARAARRARRLCRPGLRPLLLATLLYGNAPAICSSILWRREALDDAGGFDPALAVCEDLDLLLRVARRAPVLFVDRPVVGYRVSAGSLAHRAAAPFGAAYRRIHRNYREAHGAAELFGLHLLARAARPIA